MFRPIELKLYFKIHFTLPIYRPKFYFYFMICIGLCVVADDRQLNARVKVGSNSSAGWSSRHFILVFLYSE